MVMRYLSHSNIENRNRSTSFNFTGDLDIIAAVDYFDLEESANNDEEADINTKTRLIFTKYLSPISWCL